jgi:hypothetical protein
MQPVKITIQGDYVDCQIYRGRLYLWTFDGSLIVCDWDNLIDSLTKKVTQKIALTYCFKDGNYLYKSSVIDLFTDPDFKKLLNKKFAEVASQEYFVGPKHLAKMTMGAQETPTKIIPTDTEIYGNNLYFITEKGLFIGSAHRDKSEKKLVSSKPRQIWDCDLLSIKANKYPQLALSGGSEGLFELNMSKIQPENLKQIETKDSIYEISSSHSSFSNYAYLSIYNSSIADASFMALFKWNTKKDENQKDVYQRDFSKNVNENEIFNSEERHGYLSWGVEDKIYRATNNGFEIVRFNNYANEEKGEKKFTRIGNTNLHEWKGKVINGGTAYFGNIVECENALVVMLSDGSSYTIPGPITRWRVYPRSRNYENHLHVILDDRIEIFSFNQDYFLNQKEKGLGIEFKPEQMSRRFPSIKRVASSATTKDFNGDDLPF